MKLNRLILLLAALSLALAACGGGDGDTTEATDATDTTETTGGEATADFETITDGVLTVCTDAPYPPMEYEDPRQPPASTPASTSS